MKKIARAVAIATAAALVVLATGSIANADTQWGKHAGHHHHAKDTQWGKLSDTQWG
jgi:adenosyl cobinamide kinase/adenosyl cobinamide phosphate guanylyltransferase